MVWGLCCVLSFGGTVVCVYSVCLHFLTPFTFYYFLASVMSSPSSIICPMSICHSFMHCLACPYNLTCPLMTNDLCAFVVTKDNEVIMCKRPMWLHSMSSWCESRWTAVWLQLCTIDGEQF